MIVNLPLNKQDSYSHRGLAAVDRPQEVEGPSREHVPLRVGGGLFERITVCDFAAELLTALFLAPPGFAERRHLRQRTPDFGKRFARTRDRDLEGIRVDKVA